MNTRRAASVAALALVLAFSPYTRTSAASITQINDPVTDTVQLWTVVTSLIQRAAHQLAIALEHPQPVINAGVETDGQAASTLLATKRQSSAVGVTKNALATEPAPKRSSIATTTVVYRYIAQPASTSLVWVPYTSGGYVTQSEFTAGLSTLNGSLNQLIASNSFEASAYPPLGGGAPNTIAAASAIDQLSGVTITNAKLTASEIPTDIVASNYLPLSGGTLTGTLNVPIINASSTILTGFTTTTATTTNFFATNASTTNATSTTLFSTLANFGTTIASTINASIANIVGLTATNATTTNLIATNATTTNFAVLGTGYYSGDVGIGTTSPIAALDVVGDLALTGPSPWIDVKAYGAKGDGVTDDTAAIQAAINAASSTVARTVFFPAGEYKVSSTLQINARGLRLLGMGMTGGAPGVGNLSVTGGSQLDFYGTGPLIQLGTYDGLPFNDPSDFDGPQGLTISDMGLQGANNTTPLLNGEGSYATGTDGLLDWRGGSIVLERVSLQNFQYGFWGIQSDVDTFEDVDAVDNSVAVYLGPGSSQATITRMYTVYNDTAVWIDGASKERITDSQFVGDGSTTTYPIRIGTAWSGITPSQGISLEDDWFEHTSGAAEIEAFIGIGTGSGTEGGALDVSISNSFLANGRPLGSNYAKYFVEAGNAPNLHISGISGDAAIPCSNTIYGCISDLVNFVGNWSPDVQIDVAGDQNGSYINSGTGTPKIYEETIGNGATTFQGPTSDTSSSALQVTNSNNTDLLTVLGNGNVGVGTTTPSARLEVAGKTYLGDLTTTAPGSQGVLVYTGNSGGASAGIDIIRGTSWSSPASLFGLHLISDPNTGAYRAGLGFSNSSFTESLTLVSGGNIGVGTSSPWAKFSIAGNAGGTSPLFSISSSTSAFATSSVFQISSNGLVGIASSTPGSLFSLGNIANFSVATSTFYSSGGINLVSGCFAIAGNCLSLGNISGTLNNSGLTNSSLTVSPGNGLSGGGNVALGGSTSLSLNLANANSWTGLQQFTNATSTLLTSTTAWIGTLNLTNDLTVANGGTGSATLSGLLEGNGTSAITGINGITGQFPYYNGTNTLLATSSIFLATSGNVGIGTTSPLGTLHVATGFSGATPYTGAGVGSVVGVLESNTKTTLQFLSPDTASMRIWFGSPANTTAGGITYTPNTVVANGALVLRAGSLNTVTVLGNGNVGIGTTTPLTTLSIQGTVGANDVLNVASSTGASMLYVNSVGNVGIGTTSPAATLSTQGNEYTTGGLGVGLLNTISGTLQTSGNILGGGILALSGTTGTTTIAAGQGFTIGGSQLVVQQGSGSIGLGTPSPQATLEVHGNESIYPTSNPSSTATARQLIIGESSDNSAYKLALGYVSISSVWTGVIQTSAGGLGPLAINPGGGNVGIGTTSPYSRLEIWGPDTASTTAFSVANNASTTEFAVYDTGNATLAGGLIQNSDQRLKTNIQSLDASSSLSLIDQLDPITFNWIDPNKGTTPQLGFIAQQVLPIFPNLISTTSATALTPDGTLSLNYIDLISPIVSAIQALSSEITSIENTVAGFADSFTTNQLTFVRAQGSEVDVQTLCIGSTCITENQLKALLASANQSAADNLPSSNGSNATSSSPETPPVIQINGDNPATVQVGTTYNDLGATITGPQADLNLGITTFLNGTLTSNIVIDTSQVATDTIDYVAIDQNGLTSTSTRTVIITAPVESSASSTVATSSLSSQ